MRYRDWGVRSPRWAGIRSETVEVDGATVHFLRADQAPTAPPGAPVQLLVHGLAGSGIVWLDLMRALTGYGPVIAPDLPGSILGETATRRPREARAERNARFLCAFAGTLGLERVTAHGLSLGGLVVLRFAHLAPARVERLVLVNPTLPGPMTLAERIGWQTLGRLGLAVVPAVARGLVRLWGRRLIDTKLRYLTDPERFAAAARYAGGDLSRATPEILALATDQMYEVRSQPARMSYAVTAFASAMSAMFVSQRPALVAIDQVAASVLLVWGDQDPLVVRPVVDHALARRPDWRLRVLETAGHAAPLELPDAYVEAVGRWLTGDAAPRTR
jgi:pimeloyl-ACP methyl ester carboxylesterase